MCAISCGRSPSLSALRGIRCQPQPDARLVSVVCLPTRPLYQFDPITTHSRASCSGVITGMASLTRFNKICHPSQRPRWQVDKEAIGLSRVQQCSSKVVQGCSRAWPVVQGCSRAWPVVQGCSRACATRGRT